MDMAPTVLDNNLKLTQWQAAVLAEHARRMLNPLYAVLSRSSQARLLAQFCQAERVTDEHGKKVEPQSIGAFLMRNVDNHR